MPLKPRTDIPNSDATSPSKIRGWLRNTELHNSNDKKDVALFQVLDNLLITLEKTKDTANATAASAASSGNETYLTEINETATLPNSRLLAAGTGISLDVTTPGQEIINCTVTGGINQLTGDVTAGPGTGSQAATLANSGVVAGTYGDASNIPQIIVDAKGRITSATDIPISTAQAIQKLSFTIDNGSNPITSTGLQKYFSFPCTGTIIAVRILANASGDIVFDIWKDTWANRPPDNADSIVGAGTKPTLSTAQFYEDSTFTGWTTLAVTAGDLGAVEIESTGSNLTWAILEIFIQPT